MFLKFNPGYYTEVDALVNTVKYIYIYSCILLNIFCYLYFQFFIAYLKTKQK